MIHLICPDCVSVGTAGKRAFHVRGQFCSCGWNRDGARGVRKMTADERTNWLMERWGPVLARLDDE